MKPVGAPAPALRVYGSVISYYTGKLEAYLRYKELPYERVAPTLRLWNRALPRHTGVVQMPAVELPDGRFMTDTTPMIAWLEGEHPEPAVIPHDPLQAFASHLLEDFADEWLWRPALHYRWSYRADAQLLSRIIAEEMLGAVPLPAALKRLFMRLRQRRRYVRGDGVDATTRAHVEGVYLSALEALEPILSARPFLLGERPTLADFGFFASMFRHFGLDPTPSALMRERAPGVFAWLGRVWNARGSRCAGRLLDGVPSDWGPLLDAVGSAYLPYLAANAAAWGAHRRRFDFELPGVRYRALPTSRYRVWCLERLRDHYEALPESVAQQARALLAAHGGFAPLASAAGLRSGHDAERRAPFGPGLAVFG